MPEPTLDPVPFRVEFMGDPALPFIVVDGGDRSRPFDKHTMRSWLIPGEVKVEFVQLWEAYVHKSAAERILRDEAAAREAEKDGKGKRGK